MGLANPLHIAFVVLVLVLLFGARRLPELGRSLGGGLREFKGSLEGRHDPPAAVPAASLEQSASSPDAR